jgi:hypothetical protein
MNGDRAAVVPERSRYLALLALPPSIWMLHFLTSYATASVWCARFSTAGGSPGPVHSLIAVLTVVALGVITLAGWGGYRRHTVGAGETSQDDDTPESRHRFLGFATMLLAGLSAVATLYSAIAVFLFRSC